MTAQTDNKVPQIRFKGFEGDWMEKRLGDVATFINGRAYSQHELLGKGQYRVLRVGNFYTNSSWYYSDMNLPEKFYTNKGDLLYTWSASFGPHIWEGEKVIYHYHIWKVELSEALQKAFALQLLENDKKRILDNSNGSTMVHITKEGMKGKSIVIPHPAEQQKIGTYFREMDSLIGLHQRKHDKLVTLKKAMLQKMFPQPGKTTPEIRFKGFEGDWVEKKLHSLADRFDNLRVPVTASNRISGNIPYYGANGIQDYVHGYTHEGEFILVAEDGANDLKNYPVQYVSGKIWVNNHAHVLQGKKGVAETRFLKYAFSQIDMEVLLVGGGRSKLNAETMMQIGLYVPTNIAEQQKIGIYFRTLDTLISQHATQLQKLQQIKSACLQRMFV